MNIEKVGGKGGKTEDGVPQPKGVGGLSRADTEIAGVRGEESVLIGDVNEVRRGTGNVFVYSAPLILGGKKATQTRMLDAVAQAFIASQNKYHGGWEGNLLVERSKLSVPGKMPTEGDEVRIAYKQKGKMGEMDTVIVSAIIRSPDKSRKSEAQLKIRKLMQAEPDED